MTYEELVRMFKEDESYIVYVAKRFLSPRSLDLIAIDQDLPVDAFHRMFAEFPYLEEKFKAAVSDEDDNQKELMIRQSSSHAFRKLAELIEDDIGLDKKDVIQACKAILTYRPATKPKPGKENALDNIIADLIDGGDDQ